MKAHITVKGKAEMLPENRQNDNEKADVLAESGAEFDRAVFAELVAKEALD